MNSIPSFTDTGHRFAPITTDDSSGHLWISSILCLIYCSLVLLVRLHIKWNLYGADDATATVATVLQLGEVIPLFIAMKQGLGKSAHLLDASQMEAIGKSTFAAQFFLILSLAMAKASVAALMLRLFTRDINVTRKSRRLCHATLVLTAIWAIGSILAMGISCNPTEFGQETALRQCPNQLTRWRIVAAIDMLIELLLVLLPLAFVWPIQMKGYIKLQVAIAFSFRLPVIALSALHLHYMSSYINSTNPSKAIIPALVCQQFELSWSLLSATIPTLKAFMRSFNSGFGMEIDLDTPYGYGSGNNNGTYRLETMKNTTASHATFNGGSALRSHQGSMKRQDIAPSATSTPAKSAKAAGVVNINETNGSDTTFYLVNPHEERGSITSDGSQEMIIRRDVQWSVSYEERAG
ncbi:hypothetical protein B0J11DRAFT_522672 [Dendryphion nanum]|uniref:Rhodopsin domain-containing protein n=1 Tax=Dendryphion nanum TaxID=256645 RepID=A0A9P9IT65_9PLEO|nr:hypothetical protein B0J11DRAFT_522672 [Dendryphion nanum]